MTVTTTTQQPLTGTFAADPVHSSLHFALDHMQVGTFRSSFEELEMTVVAGEQGVRIDGRVEVASLAIHNPPEFRDHILNGADFFDGANHSEIVFHSDDVQLAADGSLSGHGELTIKGITKPVVATGSYQPLIEDAFGSLRTAIELTATLDRRDWDMSWQMPLPNGGDVLGYEVELSALIELVKQD